MLEYNILAMIVGILVLYPCPVAKVGVVVLHKYLRSSWCGGGGGKLERGFCVNCTMSVISQKLFVISADFGNSCIVKCETCDSLLGCRRRTYPI